jgi:uncharacterized phiE125 gp8 family phage protein
MTLRLITDATVEPVTLAEAREWCNLDADDTSGDANLTKLISAARRLAEHKTGRSFLLQTWERVVDAFPDAELELAPREVIGITSVKYIDTAGTEQTLDSAAYVLDSDSEPCFVLPAVDTEWPETLDTANAVRVRFTVGFGSSAADVGEPIWQWMQMHIATAWKLRESAVTGISVNEIPGRYVEGLLDPYRYWG